MVGLFVLFLTICLYSSSFKALALAIFVGFLDADYGGYCIIPNNITGVNNIDLAIIFGLYVILKEKRNLSVIDDSIGKKILFFFLFTICVLLFSLFYYDLSIGESLKNGRIFMMFPLVYFVFKCQTYSILNKTMTYVYRFIALSSFFYILQIIISAPIMPYFLEMKMHNFMGINVPRFYNFPPFISIACIVVFYYTATLKTIEIRIYKFLYIGAVICTFGRTLIFTVVLTLLLFRLFKTKSFKLTVFLLLGILFLTIDYIMSLNVDNRTILDIQNSFSGNFVNNPYGLNGDSTLSFRFAWFYERLDYLIHAPLYETIFGLGWFSEESASKIYDFIIGLKSDRGLPVQLYIPDISYGLILVRLGLGGLFIYLYLVVSIFLVFLNRRRIDDISLLITVLLISNVILGFSGLVLAYSFSFALLFILYFISIKYNQNEKYYANSNHNYSNL